MNGHCSTCDVEDQCGYEYKPCDCRNKMKWKPIKVVLKAVEKVSVLPVITSLDVPCERILSAALESTLQKCIIIGTDAEGKFYFASTMADGGDCLWWIEIAKRKLLELSE